MKPLAVTDAVPSSVTSPFKVAELQFTAVAADVDTVGAAEQV
jgi:hypothetical protein